MLGLFNRLVDGGSDRLHAIEGKIKTGAETTAVAIPLRSMAVHVQLGAEILNAIEEKMSRPVPQPGIAQILSRADPIPSVNRYYI